MATPISPKDLGILLSCGAVLPFAAAFGAYPAGGRKGKMLNVISFVIGLIAIAIVGVVLQQLNRY